MEFLVIVLFVVAIVVVNFVMSRAQRRKKQAGGEPSAEGSANPKQEAKPQRSPKKRVPGAAPAGPRTSVEAAREANARLDSAAHQQVYAAIAQGQPIKAVKLYVQFTGVGIRAAGTAVENLATHPQPYQPPRPASPAPATGGSSSVPSPEAANDAAEDGTTVTGPNPSVDNGNQALAPDAAAARERTPAPDADQAAAPDKTDAPDKTAARDKTAAPEGPTAPAGKAHRESAAKPPAAPAEDEISKWVKDLRPEDF
ncbi:hypothetical protein ABIB35_001965 [Arthrobacter sp. UYP6]|uniref:hypothetical protein n=1 Tax=Arthrobacter sp. UYP6 TaxID=1756378 RepID=UPI003391D2F1